MDRKHCAGCHDAYYHGNTPEKKCWSFDTAELVERIPVGMWEQPPYEKKTVLVPKCWHGKGSNRTLYIKPEVLTEEGYWK